MSNSVWTKVELVEFILLYNTSKQKPNMSELRKKERILLRKNKKELEHIKDMILNQMFTIYSL